MLNEILIYIFGKRNSIFLAFHQNYQMSDKINSHICLMLGVYKRFHQMVKYGWQSNHILQGLTGLEI